MGGCASCLWDSRERLELKVTKQTNPIKLSRRTKGTNVTLEADGVTVSGTGVALSVPPIVQDRVIFEAKIIRTGPFCFGVANEEEVDADASLWEQPSAWVLSSTEQAISYGGAFEAKLTSYVQFNIGDIITCAYDQDTIRFFVNGLPLQYEPPLFVHKLRGLIQVAVSVAPPCRLELIFANEEISYPLHQQGYHGLLIERTML